MSNTLPQGQRWLYSTFGVLAATLGSAVGKLAASGNFPI